MLAFISALPLEQTDKEFALWLYQKYKNLMYLTAKKQISSPEVIEDILQDSIIKLIEKIEVLRSLDQHALAGYIVATVRNTSINFLKKQSISEKSNDGNDSGSDENTTFITLEDLVLLNERAEQLLHIWPKLSDTDRYLLEGKYVLGYSDAELAQQLYCKPASIRMKLTRARRTAFALLMQSEGGFFNDET